MLYTNQIINEIIKNTQLFAIGSLTFSLVISWIALFSMWVIYEKAGRKGYCSIIPFYNMYVMADIAMGNGILFLLSFIPCIGQIFLLVLYYKFFKKFGKGIGFYILYLILPLIALPILAFGNSEFDDSIKTYNKKNNKSEEINIDEDIYDEINEDEYDNIDSFENEIDTNANKDLNSNEEYLEDYQKDPINYNESIENKNQFDTNQNDEDEEIEEWDLD